MPLELPDDDKLYVALVARDAAYDGHVFVAVTTTRVFCRMTCPARKPKREHCRFFGSARDCIEAGFRPCKRCLPLFPAAMSDPVVNAFLGKLDHHPGHRWSENEIRASGFDPSTVRRAFRRHFGMTFLEMARHRRLYEGIRTLKAGGKVIEAQIDAGFESSSAFRGAFAKLLGQAPGDFAPNARLLADWIETPLGAMVAVSDRHSLQLLEFVDRRALPSELRQLRNRVNGSLGFGRPDPTEQVADELGRYLAGESAEFTTPISLHGSAFTQRVWRVLREIPPGHTRSYSEVARIIGQPTAIRAVARANGANQLAIVIPCHRVIGADGSLTGYGGGLWRKQRLIEMERAYR